MKKSGITGSTLKIIAVVAMFLDHTAAVILERLLARQTSIFYYMGRLSEEKGMSLFLTEVSGHKLLFGSWCVMRMIGRIGFPIFCFLLVQGFMHTRSALKYALRLFVFAVLSEIPFDLALSDRWFYPEYQNVMFTLLIGILAMILFRTAEKIPKRYAHAAVNIVITACACMLADFLKTDYAGFGVLCIIVLYYFRNEKKRTVCAGSIIFGGYSALFNLLEIASVFAFIPIGMYNKERGIRIKYFFYVFYPAHLFAIYLAAYFMGIV